MNRTNYSQKLSDVTKLTLMVVALAGMATASAQSSHSPKYTLVDLGVAGPAGQPFHITNNSIISAAVGAADGTDHSVVYFHHHTIDISNRVLGGLVAPNVAGGSNLRMRPPAHLSKK